MGPFDLFHKKGSKPIQSQPPRIRKQIVVSQGPAPPKSSDRIVSSVSSRASPALQVPKNHAQPRSRSAQPRLQKSRKRPSPVQARLESDSDDETDGEDEIVARRKRTRLSTEPPIDAKRKIRCKKVDSENEDGRLEMVHSKDIASSSKSTKYKAAFPELKLMRISLQYPSTSHPETYELVEPIHHDEFNPLEEIREVLIIVGDYYLPLPARTTLMDETKGLLRRLKVAISKRAGDDYKEAIQEWNDLVTSLVNEEVISGIIDSWNSVDLKLIERILTQTYARTVSPRINSLRQYENGTDNVYGELLPKFISDILKKDTKMTSEQVFVDLGSGVGNVVLQAALQIGCESWGCEMMGNACDLAELQQKEFSARCRLWGLAIGSIRLERGDFLDNREIGEVIKRADVILVNNQAFTPDLNESLTSLFLDAKEGCQIVSLKSFVPSGHKITSRNLNRACNVLKVTEKHYYSSCVSWTDAPGTYYVSIKDSSRVAKFADKHVYNE